MPDTDEFVAAVQQGSRGFGDLSVVAVGRPATLLKRYGDRSPITFRPLSEAVDLKPAHELPKDQLRRLNAVKREARRRRPPSAGEVPRRVPASPSARYDQTPIEDYWAEFDWRDATREIVEARAAGRVPQLSPETLQQFTDALNEMEMYQLAGNQTLTRSVVLANKGDDLWLDWYRANPLSEGEDFTAAMPTSWSFREAEATRFALQHQGLRLYDTAEEALASDVIEMRTFIHGSRGGQSTRMGFTKFQDLEEAVLQPGQRYRVVSVKEHVEHIQSHAVRVRGYGYVRRLDVEIETVPTEALDFATARRGLRRSDWDGEELADGSWRLTATADDGTPMEVVWSEGEGYFWRVGDRTGLSATEAAARRAATQAAAEAPEAAAAALDEALAAMRAAAGPEARGASLRALRTAAVGADADDLLRRLDDIDTSDWGDWHLEELARLRTRISEGLSAVPQYRRSGGVPGWVAEARARAAAEARQTIAQAPTRAWQSEALREIADLPLEVQAAAERIGRLVYAPGDEIGETLEFLEELAQRADILANASQRRHVGEAILELRRQQAGRQPGTIPPIPSRGAVPLGEWEELLQAWWRREVREGTFDLQDDMRLDVWDIPKWQRASAIMRHARGEAADLSDEALEVIADIDSHARTVRLADDQTLTRSMRIFNETDDPDLRWLDWWADPDVGEEFTTALPDSWSLDPDWAEKFAPRTIAPGDDLQFLDHMDETVDVVMTIRGGNRATVMPVHSAKANELEMIAPAGVRFRVVGRHETSEAIRRATADGYVREIGRVRRIHLDVEEIIDAPRSPGDVFDLASGRPDVETLLATIEETQSGFARRIALLDLRDMIDDLPEDALRAVSIRMDALDIDSLPMVAVARHDVTEIRVRLATALRPRPATGRRRRVEPKDWTDAKQPDGSWYYTSGDMTITWRKGEGYTWRVGDLTGSAPSLRVARRAVNDAAAEVPLSPVADEAIRLRDLFNEIREETGNIDRMAAIRELPDAVAPDLHDLYRQLLVDLEAEVTVAVQRAAIRERLDTIDAIGDLSGRGGRPVRPGAPGWEPGAGVRGLATVDPVVDGDIAVTALREAGFFPKLQAGLYSLEDEVFAQAASSLAWLGQRYPTIARRLRFEELPARLKASADTGQQNLSSRLVNKMLRAREDGEVIDWIPSRIRRGQMRISSPAFTRRGDKLAEAAGPDLVGGWSRRWGPAKAAEVTLNQRTIIHEWGHQVGFDAATYWAVDYATTRADDILESLERALRRMSDEDLDRLRIAESTDDIDDIVDLWGGMAPDLRFQMLTERHGELAIAVKLEELTDAVGAPRSKSGSRRSSWRGHANFDLSYGASKDPHEFAAESFVAVTLYGDDAPPLARRLVQEMEAVQDAMDAETAAALSWRLPPGADTGEVADVIRGLDLEGAAAAGRTRLGQRRLADETEDLWRFTREEFEAQAAGRTPAPEEVHAILANAFGTADYRRIVEEALSAERTSTYIAIRRADLTRAVKEDRFKNSLETGKGSFKTVGTDRFDLEQSVFGINRTVGDVTPDDLPKYGFTAGSDDMDWDSMVGRGYGENFVEFHDGVRARSTRTLGDSFDGNKGGRATPATPVNDMNVDDFLTALLNTIERDDPYGEAGRRMMVKFASTGDYRDLLRAAKVDYAEVQMFGPLSLDDVRAIEVESLAYSRTLRRALDKAGHEHIPIRAARDHSRLQAIRTGEIDAFYSLSPDDIDAFGDFYINRVFEATYKSYFGRSSEWRGTEFPEEVKPWIQRIRDGEPFTVEQKREALTAWYADLAKGPDSTLPKTFTKDFRKSKAGFTDDVMNRSLLDGPPARVS